MAAASTWRAWGQRCLAAGFLLSAAIVMPAVRASGFSPGATVLGAAMFLFVASPFLLFAVVHRFTSNPRLVVTSCGPYLACHLFLAAAYLFDDVRPREFGYLGLFLVPFYESLIALPAIVIAEATMRVIERRSGLG